MGFGRFICVALPFLLTAASLIAILVVMLAGITNKDLYMFDIDTKNLSVSSSTLVNAKKIISRDVGLGALTTAAQGPNMNVNITAKTLQLADNYKVALWSYCATTGTNTTCTKGAFDWAATSANATQIEILARTAVNYDNITIPKDMSAALKTFVAVNKWTEVVYIIAILLTAAELIVGITSFFSRIGSCFTYILSGLSSTAIMAASIMATAEISVAVGSIKTVSKLYGLDAGLNLRFLVTTWIAVAFSLASGFFWLFTICCCAAEHKKRTQKRGGHDAEKHVPAGGYQRVADPHHYNGAQQSGIYAPQTHAPQHAKPQHRGAYEPYSHSNI